MISKVNVHLCNVLFDDNIIVKAYKDGPNRVVFNILPIHVVSSGKRHNVSIVFNIVYFVVNGESTVNAGTRNLGFYKNTITLFL